MDMKVTRPLCCCGNLELDTAVDIGFRCKWSDTSNGEVSNIYLRLFFGAAWRNGNSRGLEDATGTVATSAIIGEIERNVIAEEQR